VVDGVAVLLNYQQVQTQQSRPKMIPAEFPSSTGNEMTTLTKHVGDGHVLALHDENGRGVHPRDFHVGEKRQGAENGRITLVTVFLPDSS
jgi:hypothetical protein